MPVVGYTGLYRQPFSDNITYGDTIYVITDDAHQELNIVILTPGAYAEVFRMASAITFQRINLFVPSMDALFLSDVFRLVVDLQKIKKTVRWYYPERIDVKPPNMLFERAQVLSTYYLSKSIDGLTISFQSASPDLNKTGLYDFKIYDGRLCDYFSLYMTKEKMANLLKSGIDRVHFAYNSTFYGGCTVRELTDYHSWRSHIIPNNFMNREEFREAQHGMYGTPYRVVF